MIENDYLLAWGVYAIAALGCLLVWFRLTRWMWRYLREPLRVLVAVLLFSPTVVDPVKEEVLAPAIAISAMDLLLDVGNSAWRAVADLAMYGLVAFALYLLFVAIRWPLERWWKGRRGPQPQAGDEDVPTLREIMQRENGDYADTRYDQGGKGRTRVEPRL
ncbi:MFS transporter [Pseudomonas sp. sp1636]|uniref:MFS transporter n=1 Tax=Pseudomonas sp. sp1636 TaxID=3036707 RepID=UPI0025A665F1|nr:MFS transporter [Pseudomonas sp. sp1636]MDM8350749.1 MFS transporter [Pseudomonas sp. sp1636]